MLIGDHVGHGSEGSLDAKDERRALRFSTESSRLLASVGAFGAVASSRRRDRGAVAFLCAATFCCSSVTWSLPDDRDR